MNGLTSRGGIQKDCRPLMHHEGQQSFSDIRLYLFTLGSVCFLTGLSFSVILRKGGHRVKSVLNGMVQHILHFHGM